ncbi:glycoside hydrolase family 27 protein [Winogradskya humida]|uniref:Alpha-galactosidase n=1 Tax=Winogradskya humida TaxID=113566 RepID=A0ABQ4A5C5_9ACTN|nr:glycoside hydrolase family 27 protein [Actinoplanes humidus]GIE26046.1 alpha-galactosidase [Actinoplanes humidus]
MLAATPPMGWNSWNQVHCYELDENVVKRAADALVTTGMRDAGYEYVVVDDCWQAHTRDADGNLQPHPSRFPGGIAALAGYVHERGLKFGLYSSPGTDTCAMHYDEYPGTLLGSLGHEQQDADLFASWGVDFLKYDWCLADINAGLEPVPAFTHMRDSIAATGRPIVYSISEYGRYEPWKWGPGIGNMWRTTDDLFAEWNSVAGVIDQQLALIRGPHTSRPGAWNDPDMLQVGNGNLTDDENRTHFSIWAMLAAPLFIGTDLDALSPIARQVLLNTDVIAVDQDPLGRQATVLAERDGTVVLGKELTGGDHAVALYNSTAAPVTISAALPGFDQYELRDLWTGARTGGSGEISALVGPHCTEMFRVTPR